MKTLLEANKFLHSGLNPMHGCTNILGRLSILLCLLLPACATVHPGKKATALHGKSDDHLIVSCEANEEASSKAFAMVQCTFENTSDQWMRFSGGEIVLDTNETKLSVVVGEDLQTWADSMMQQKAMDYYNRELAKSTIAAGGLIIAATTDSKDMAIAGLATVGAVAAYDVVSEYAAAKTKATSPDWVPKSHLNSAFALPGGLFARKWVLLNKSGDSKLNNLVIRVKSLDGNSEDYLVAMHGNDKGS